MTGQVTLPFQAHSGTSREAAVRGAASAKSLRQKVYEFLVLWGPSTDREMQEGLHLDGSTQRPRRVELFREGRVVEHGRRVQPNGRSATIWRAV